MKRGGTKQTDSARRGASPLRRLNGLVGSWRLSGRTFNSPRDDIRGKVVVEWLPGGHLLQLRSEIRVGKFTVQSLEIVSFDPVSKAFPSFVYTNVDQVPLKYSWKVQGGTVVHSGLGATFTGTWSDRGRILSGAWQADPGVAPSPQNTYTAKMTRTR